MARSALTTDFSGGTLHFFSLVPYVHVHAHTLENTCDTIGLALSYGHWG